MRRGSLAALTFLIVPGGAQCHDHHDAANCYECLPQHPEPAAPLRLVLPIFEFPSLGYQPLALPEAQEPTDKGQAGGNDEPFGARVWGAILAWLTKLIADPMAVITTALVILTSRYVVHSGRQAAATIDAINLARAEFNATHGPKITARGFFIYRDMARNGVFGMRCVVENRGLTPATVTEFKEYLRFSDGEGTLFRIVRTDPSLIPSVIGPGNEITWVGTVNLEGERFSAATKSGGEGAEMEFRLTVYHHNQGVRLPPVSFHRKYDFKAKRFIRIEDSEFDYQN